MAPRNNPTNDVYSNPVKFRKSIHDELSVIKDRIRNIIGRDHWGEDGAYKEAILRNVLKRFLPKDVSVNSGFIVQVENQQIIKSSQIDIIIHDNSYPPIFSEGDFIITTPMGVKGIIEVKTNISSSNLLETIQRARNNYRFLSIYAFNGIFSYESTVQQNYLLNNMDFESEIKQWKGHFNHVCLGENIFIKSFDREFKIYRLNKLASGYFLSNLIDTVTHHDLRDNSQLWYPIPEGKEPYCIREISCHRE